MENTFQVQTRGTSLPETETKKKRDNNHMKENDGYIEISLQSVGYITYITESIGLCLCGLINIKIAAHLLRLSLGSDRRTL